MQNRIEAYKIWAPDHALWTDWAKPVIFAEMMDSYADQIMQIPDEIMLTYDEHAAVIVDLEGKDSVLEGIGLAKIGYRPVPLFNGVMGPVDISLVDVSEIMVAINSLTEVLSSISISYNAPPVFLLDFNRMNGTAKKPGSYDNRWSVFPQDMPSASFLQKNGINKVILRSNHVNDDLSHILCRYQESGLRIFLKTEKQPLKEITAIEPSRFKCLMYRIGVISGLKRNSSGGFGGMIPDPESYSGRIGYYGFG
ncbi:MAG: hypothetical protein LBI03_05085 [Clostridiales bacterium]|jgi:hypothetical protein|nr:hypothetical protein [Clostridiales bacterium]